MRVKRLLAGILSVAMLFSMMSFSASAESTADVWDGTADTTWFDEKNQQAEYILTSAEQLAGLSDILWNYSGTNNLFTDITIKLGVDVDLANIPWRPIGLATNANSSEKGKWFGSFDGQGHTISNLYINSNEYQHSGLFGYTGSATQSISNVTLNNVDITNGYTTKPGTAALVGRINGDAFSVSNVALTGTVDIEGNQFVGGIAGYGRGTINNCTVEATGTISAAANAAGGLVGIYYGSSDASVSDSTVKNVEISAQSGQVGGAIGNADSNTTIDNITVAEVTLDAGSKTSAAYVSYGATATNSTVANTTVTNDSGVITPTDADVDGVESAVAEVDGEYYTDIVSALKALEDNSVLNLLSDVTISDKWDCRNTKITAPATINGNGHTLKFTNAINDGYNHLAAFRVEADTTFNDLTIDMSEAVSVFQSRFSAISTNGCDLTVDGCTFIGSTTYTKGRAIIFGEGGTAADEAEISVTDSQFVNWRYGVVDNMNGVDVAKSVEISGCEFTASAINISASDEVTLTDNIVTDADVIVTSYSAVTELKVVATGNTLDETATNYIVANEIETDSEEFNLPVADIEGKKFISIAAAAKAVAAGESATITVLGDVSDENITIKGNVTLVSGSVAVYALRSSATTLNNVIFTVENGASLSLDGFNVTGLSYIYAKTPDSISVTNCNIDVTTVEVSGTNCPPAFVLFSSSNDGSVEFTFTNNTLLAAPDVTEDWYTYSHGISGWNSIESATITGNTFGSAEAPLGAAAIKLMNFVEGAEVDVSNNTFYVNSQDSTWGPNAIQFYQNNSRANNYSVTVAANNFYVDAATAAIGVNVNSMNNPELYTGGATVAVAEDNTVNDRAIALSDIIVFGNGINNEGFTRTYVGLGIEYDEDGSIIGGKFSDKSLGLEAALADGYAIEKDVAGNLHVAEEALLVDEIKVEFAPASEAEGEKVYNINLTAGGDVINRLNSADLTFLFTQVEGLNDYEIIASNSEVAINTVDNSKVRYEFHYNGKTDVTTDTNATITIGQVKFTGYGKFSFAVDESANGTNAAHATKLFDNIVDTFVPGGVLADGTAVGEFDVTDNTITDVVIAVPTRTLTINLDFPNAVEDNAIAYQDMKVEITGNIDGVNKTVTYNLGTDEVAMVNGSYVVTDENLVLNNAYTVTVSGAGYRTARYTVTMTEDKTLRFWNNVMDEAQFVEIGKESSRVNITFLAGDIVKDNNINIYDLSAVVSYFGTENCVNSYPEYAKYDLNRDGVIDSKDVAYVLVSWNN